MEEASKRISELNVSSTFNSEIIRDVLKGHFSNPKNKINHEAVELMGELAKVLVIEACLRAAKQASLENKKTVTLEHVEAIVPQLMLDFP